jgi:endonuclease III
LAYFLLLLEVDNLKESSMNPDMQKKMAELESINDQLSAEIKYLDQLLKQVGFDEGLKTLKSAAQELIEEEDL